MFSLYTDHSTIHRRRDESKDTEGRGTQGLRKKGVRCTMDSNTTRSEGRKKLTGGDRTRHVPCPAGQGEGGASLGFYELFQEHIKQD